MNNHPTKELPHISAAEASKIGGLLTDLFDENSWRFDSYPVTVSKGKFHIDLGNKTSAYEDIVNVYAALRHAGLIDEGTNVRLGERGLTNCPDAFVDNDIPLGFAKPDGGYYDRMKLSDNAAALAQNERIIFEVSFQGKSLDEIENKLNDAIDFIKEKSKKVPVFVDTETVELEGKSLGAKLANKEHTGELDGR